MRRGTELPELLAPAGSFEALVAAIDAGADAVYFGGRRMNARAFARNFDGDEMRRAIDYCHLHGRRAYVTLNTALTTRELKEAIEYAAELYGLGVDALITADLGLIAELHRALPSLELHASTQAALHSSDGANLLARELGVKRVVLARELSLENIRSAVERADAEIEVFLHGALCVSHSGQCLFSSLVGGRSGNRGECAQPCRLPYNGKYPLSLRDLCLASAIPELIGAGVSSLKIEGRMKSPSYVYGVTEIYRRLLDERRAATEKELAQLARIFSRGGFTDGYLRGKHTVPMTGIRSERDKQESRAVSEAVFEPKAVRAEGVCEIFRGRPARLTLTAGTMRATVEGEIPSEARTAPLDSDAVAARLARLGGTGLTASPSDIRVTCEASLNLAPSALNELRRRAVAALTESGRRDAPDITYRPPRSSLPREAMLSASFRDAAQLDGLPPRLRGALDETYLYLPALAEITGELPSGVWLPAVVTDRERDEVAAMLRYARSRGISCAMIDNPAQLALVREAGMEAVGGHRLNVTNSSAADFWCRMGLRDLILSPELPAQVAGKVGGRVITAGHLPLMLLERCFIRENFGCESCHSAALTDRRGASFRLLREHPHRNLLLNGTLTYMGDKQAELASLGIRRAHLLFTAETPEQCRTLLSDYLAGRAREGVRRLPKSY